MKVHTLDLHFRETPGLIASYLVESAGHYALIETGAGSTLPRLIEALAEHDLQPSNIGSVFITHVHLDHAGAAGWWAQQGVPVFCHARAARHLIDPSRLIESARQVYGDAFDTLWGEILPAPEDRVRILRDGETANIGDIELTAWDTPGHARHHHVYVAGDVCFTGDVAGMRLQSSQYLSVTSAPPQFELEPYMASIQRLLDAQFQSLFLTHFGEVTDVSDHLTRYADRLREVTRLIQQWLAAGHDDETIRLLFTASEERGARAAGISEALWNCHQMANPTGMSADGLSLWARSGDD